MRRRSSSANRARWELSAGPGFDPRDVPEIAAGYYWEAANSNGIGTAAFKVIEGNGHSSFDFVQATVASQPTVLTENGGVQFRMRKSADANPSILGTSGAVTAGWTGATYLGMWLRLPDASGDITSNNSGWFIHSTTTGNQRRFSYIPTITVSDRNIATTSSTGADSTTTRVVHWNNANYTWAEMIFDPLLTLGGSAFPDKTKIFHNLVLQTRVQDANLDHNALFDASATIDICNRAHGLGTNDTTDWAAAYYGNGIPSLANRVKLANRRNPTGILLS